MVNALDDYVILGIKTSIDFLKEVIAHPQFTAGKTTTSFIEKNFPGWQGKAKTEESMRLALIASAFDDFSQAYSSVNKGAVRKEVYSPWQALGRWRIGGKE